eukprot:13039300-Alexandrium_andersonii.AAC.1
MCIRDRPRARHFRWVGPPPIRLCQVGRRAGGALRCKQRWTACQHHRSLPPAIGQGGSSGQSV